MKFAIPLADGKQTDHFGHCKEFVLIDADTGKIINKRFLTPPAHEPGSLPKWIAELGVNVAIAGGIGARAVEHLGSQYKGIVAVCKSPCRTEVCLTSDTGEIPEAAGVSTGRGTHTERHRELGRPRECPEQGAACRFVSGREAEPETGMPRMRRGGRG